MRYYMRCIDCGQKWYDGESILEDNQGNIFCSEECVLHFYGVNQDETKLRRTDNDSRCRSYDYDYDFNLDDEDENENEDVGCLTSDKALV